MLRTAISLVTAAFQHGDRDRPTSPTTRPARHDRPGCGKCGTVTKFSSEPSSCSPTTRDLAEAKIAEVLGCSVGSVKSDRALDLKRLRLAMGSTLLPETEGDAGRPT